MGVGCAGFLIGGIGGGNGGSAVGFAWGAGIGYGFGSIFSLTRATKRIVAYWAGTLALVGPFFGLIIGAGAVPHDTLFQQVVSGGLGAVVGALLGLLVGAIQYKRLRRRESATLAARSEV